MRKPSPNHTTRSSVGASFRDPAGHIFLEGDEIFRQVNQVGLADFALFETSGLYSALIRKNLIVAHDTVHSSDDHIIIKPERIDFITYPFEWSFSQLQDAALLTLTLQSMALKHGMTLKDASAYNVQFQAGKPVFIDTLSFEKYNPGEPWQAYRQFCQHFLAPLALMAHSDLSLQQLLRINLDGIPLPLASKLLPAKAKIRPGIAMHIVLHSKAQQAKASDHTPRATQQALVTQKNLEAIIDSLQRTVKSLKLPKTSTEWGDYYANNTNYSSSAAQKKSDLIVALLKPLAIKKVLDLGGNNGEYSRPLHKLGITTVCTDIDPNAVEANYQTVKKHSEDLMLPMLVDLTNPGGLLGWQNNERSSIQERLQCDATMALALIHHLAISNNVPLGLIAECFAAFSPYVIVEFVPKSDSQVQKLLATRKDIFPDYHEAGLKDAFKDRFDLVQESPVTGSDRTLYLFQRKQ
jgi:ribosomal protein L11 methylase PrmA